MESRFHYGWLQHGLILTGVDSATEIFPGGGGDTDISPPQNSGETDRPHPFLSSRYAPNLAPGKEAGGCRAVLKIIGK